MSTNTASPSTKTFAELRAEIRERQRRFHREIADELRALTRAEIKASTEAKRKEMKEEKRKKMRDAKRDEQKQKGQASDEGNHDDHTVSESLKRKRVETPEAEDNDSDWEDEDSDWEGDPSNSEDEKEEVLEPSCLGCFAAQSSCWVPRQKEAVLCCSRCREYGFKCIPWNEATETQQLIAELVRFSVIEHLGRERIALVRAVEAHDQDMAVTLERDGLEFRGVAARHALLAPARSSSPAFAAHRECLSQRTRRCPRRTPRAVEHPRT